MFWTFWRVQAEIFIPFSKYNLLWIAESWHVPRPFGVISQTAYPSPSSCPLSPRWWRACNTWSRCFYNPAEMGKRIFFLYLICINWQNFRTCRTYPFSTSHQDLKNHCTNGIAMHLPIRAQLLSKIKTKSITWNNVVPALPSLRAVYLSKKCEPDVSILAGPLSKAEWVCLW